MEYLGMKTVLLFVSVEVDEKSNISWIYQHYYGNISWNDMN